MSGKGGSAQDRRRAKRAQQRGDTIDLSEFAALAAQVEPALVAAMKGECANCGDMASDHYGVNNDGACSVQGCSCDAMEEMSSEATVAEADELAIPASADYRPATNDQTCSTCEAYSAGQCSMWDAAVEADYTCNDWEPQTQNASKPRPYVKINRQLQQTSTASSGSSVFQINFAPAAVEEAADALARGAVLSATEDAATSPDLLAAIKQKFEGFLMEFDSIVADAVPVPVEHTPGETLPAPNASPLTPVSPALNRGHRWTAVFVPEATLTDDGRAMAPGSVKWRELPLTLMGLTETSAEGGHDGAIICGRIDSIWRDGNLVRASGIFDDSEFGLEIARMVGEKVLTGVSVDLAIHEYEVGARSDYFDENGVWLTEAAEKEEVEAEEPSLVDLLFGPEEDAIFVVTDAVIGMSTVCPFPAFAEASIALEASLVAASSPAVLTVTQQGGWTCVREKKSMWTAADLDVVEPLTASGAGLVPVAPPAEWFDNPELTELTAMTVTDDGRVFGHAWEWDTCHLSFPDRCTTAPHSITDYAYFLLKEVACDNGSRVPVGTITIDAPHAGQKLSRLEATAHYDHTGTAVADVTFGEDEFGGWVAGALRSDVSEEKARALRGASLSGDWRNVNGNLELVALLAVNVPGFPVPRPKALVASGEDGEEVMTLVAAGIHAGPRPADPDQDFREIAALADFVDYDPGL